MSFSDDLLQQVSKLASSMSPDHAGLADGVLDIIKNKDSGGLAGLVQSFRDKGLGDLVSSWVGAGQNSPVSSEQIQSALGSERLKQLAAKVGIAPETAASGLALVLPKLIDKLTPDGKVPEAEGLQGQGLNFVKSKTSQS